MYDLMKKSIHLHFSTKFHLVICLLGCAIKCSVDCVSTSVWLTRYIRAFYLLPMQNLTLVLPWDVFAFKNIHTSWVLWWKKNNCCYLWGVSLCYSKSNLLNWCWIDFIFSCWFQSSTMGIPVSSQNFKSTFYALWQSTHELVKQRLFQLYLLFMHVFILDRNPLEVWFAVLMLIVY